MTDTLEPAGTLFRNDGQASETELATRLVSCPACHAAPGQGCKHSDAYSDVHAEPHYGRVELLRALRRYIVAHAFAQAADTPFSGDTSIPRRKR